VQRFPSVALRSRTLRRALSALARRVALGVVDMFGALYLFGALTGKAFAFSLAYDDTLRLLAGLVGAATSGMHTLPWPWRALAAPPLCVALAAPAALMFAIFALQRVFVVDRALLGFTACVTAAHVALTALQAAAAATGVPLPAPLSGGGGGGIFGALPARAGTLFFAAARAAAAALGAGLLLRLSELTPLL
jgi:hypothetical protein